MGGDGAWTRIAGWMALGWALLLIQFGLLLLVALPPLIRSMEGGYCENIDHPGPCSSLVDLYAPGAVVLSLGIVSLVPGVGLFERRPWSRWAAMVVYSLWSIGGFTGALASAAGRDRSVAGTLICFAFAAYAATIVALSSERFREPSTARTTPAATTTSAPHQTRTWRG